MPPYFSMSVHFTPPSLFSDHLFVFLYLVLAAVSVHHIFTLHQGWMLLLVSGECLALSLLSRSVKGKNLFSGAALFFLLLFTFTLHTGMRLTSPFVLSADFVKKMDHFRNMELYGFVKSLVTGNRNTLSISLKDLFSRTGSYHLIAVSGLHFGMAATLFLIPLSLLGKRKKLLLLFIFLTLYLFLTQFYVSAFRAYLMIGYGLAAAAGAFRIQPLNAWAFATTVILFLQPYQISSLSFWLSVLATFGILVSLPILRLIKWVPVKVLAVSVMAQLPIIPLMGIYFHQINILSPLLNLFAVLFLYPLIIIGFFLLLPLPPFLSAFFVFCEEGISMAFLKFLSLFDNPWNCRPLDFSWKGAVLYWGIYLLCLVGVFRVFQIRDRRKQNRGSGYSVKWRPRQ